MVNPQHRDNKVHFIPNSWNNKYTAVCLSNRASIWSNPGPQICTFLCHWPRNCRTFHFAFIVHNNASIIFKIYEWTILPSILFPLPYNHCLQHWNFLFINFKSLEHIYKMAPAYHSSKKSLKYSSVARATTLSNSNQPPAKGQWWPTFSRTAWKRDGNGTSSSLPPLFPTC